MVRCQSGPNSLHGALSEVAEYIEVPCVLLQFAMRASGHEIACKINRDMLSWFSLRNKGDCTRQPAHMCVPVTLEECHPIKSLASSGYTPHLPAKALTPTRSFCESRRTIVRKVCASYSTQYRPLLVHARSEGRHTAEKLMKEPRQPRKRARQWVAGDHLGGPTANSLQGLFVVQSAPRQM
jgi:hypothetical protein